MLQKTVNENKVQPYYFTSPGKHIQESIDPELKLKDTTLVFYV